MPGLFRPEAFQGQQREWLGSIQLLRPTSMAWLTWFVVIGVAVVASFLWSGQYTRKARVSGYLVPDRGVIRLVAPQPATVLESHVAEGGAVHAGDVLFVLAVGQATLSGDTQAAVKSSLVAREQILHGAARRQQQLQQAQSDALDAEIAGMRRELGPMAVEAQIQSQRLALAEQALARLESLRIDNFVSSAHVQTKSEELLGLRAQQQALERQRAGHLRQIAALQAQRDALPLRTEVQRAETLRELASLAQQGAENEARGRLVIKAMRDGVVTGVLAEPGQSVGPAVALASLVPADIRLKAHLYAPSSAVGFLRPQQAVLLRYQAFPYQKFGHQAGAVEQVSRSPLQAAEMSALSLPAGNGEPLYRITVILAKQSVDAYGEPQALAPGMQVDADVLLDRRRLIEWIFEPLLGMVGRSGVPA